jgi:DNA-binding protein H-NS
MLSVAIEAVSLQKCKFCLNQNSLKQTSASLVIRRCSVCAIWTAALLCDNYYVVLYLLYISKRTLPEKAMSQQFNLDAMTVEKLWELHAKIGRVLSDRLTSRKLELEKLLARLSARTNVELSDQPEALSSKGLANVPRRKYPRVFPKFRNPQVPSETWSGRGKQPRWLSAALETGRKIDEFVITDAVGS